MSALPLSTPLLNRLEGTMQNPPHTSPATASERQATTRQVLPCHSRAASTIEHAITCRETARAQASETERVAGQAKHIA